MLGGRGKEHDKVKWVIKTMKTKGRKEGDFTLLPEESLANPLLPYRVLL